MHTDGRLEHMLLASEGTGSCFQLLKGSTEAEGVTTGKKGKDKVTDEA